MASSAPLRKTPVSNVFVKVLGEVGLEIDYCFSPLEDVFGEDSMLEFLALIIREREELVGK